jgi:predicted HTH domain antitoxin
MNRETFAVSQKELQRVAVISASLKGEVACVRVAELLSLSVRQIKEIVVNLNIDTKKS